MNVSQHTLSITTSGRGTLDITRQVAGKVAESRIRQGICQVFITHTSASLMLCENADPDVRDDLERFMARMVPDGDPLFAHSAEGPDDMPAHIRSVLTQASLSIPIDNGQCLLGTWQGLYLWEHRTARHQRQLIVTVFGTR